MKTNQTVYVVGWHYNGGGGFDWYPTCEEADKAFEEEKENAREFKNDDWTAYRFDFVTAETDRDKITDTIDDQLEELCEKAPRSFKA